jgi:hypothetical protein
LSNYDSVKTGNFFSMPDQSLLKTLRWTSWLMKLSAILSLLGLLAMESGWLVQ